MVQNRRRFVGTVRRVGARATAYGAVKAGVQAARTVKKVYKKFVQRRKRGMTFGKSLIGSIKATAGDVTGGDYSQFCDQTIKTGRFRPTTIKTLARTMRNHQEPSIYRWNGLKNFDDFGYYQCGRDTTFAAGLNTYMPLYAYDLTAVNNYISGAYSAAQPFLRASIVKATGLIQWSIQDCPDATGAVSTTSLTNEKYPSNTQQNQPLEHSTLKWTDVRINLWGSKNKAHKFIIQLVKFLDDDIDPRASLTSGLSVNGILKHNSYWQSVMKPLMFNPAATTNVQPGRKIKVLKTFTKIIQPTSSTENDTDPHAHVLKWFMRWDRDMTYRDTASQLNNYTDVANQADYSFADLKHSNYPMSKDRIYLIIRASAYTDVAGFDSATQPSFDLSVRASHVVQL